MTLIGTSQDDGSFRPSTETDLAGWSFYFGVSFLDEAGYFDRNKRFWTERDFPEAEPVRERIMQKLKSFKSEDQLLKTAIDKLAVRH